MIESPSAVVYSTLRADAAAEFVTKHYDWPAPLTCALLRRGFNDTFEVKSCDGRRAILRLSCRRGRGDADVAGETAFLAYLDAQGVPVAAAIPTRTGALFTNVDLPEGSRAAALFREAEGRAPRDTPADARANGVTLARLHDAADVYRPKVQEQRRLDVDHLLHAPLAAILALPDLDDYLRKDLADLGARLAAGVTAQKGLAWTRCHGDCHGHNSHIAQDGRAIFFDFDDGGFGYLAYDLAVFLWAQVSFNRNRHSVWHAFIEGYRATREIRALDFEAVHLFVPIRHIWLLGEYAARTAEWGRENASADWIGDAVDFLLEWEREKLGVGLF